MRDAAGKSTIAARRLADSVFRRERRRGEGRAGAAGGRRRWMLPRASRVESSRVAPSRGGWRVAGSAGVEGSRAARRGNGGARGRAGGRERRPCSGCGRVSARRGAPAAARHDSTPGELRTTQKHHGTLSSRNRGPPKSRAIRFYACTRPRASVCSRDPRT